jgi:iron(III) transport system substrate-binding protein
MRQRLSRTLALGVVMSFAVACGGSQPSATAPTAAANAGATAVRAAPTAANAASTAAPGAAATALRAAPTAANAAATAVSAASTAAPGANATAASAGATAGSAAPTLVSGAATAAPAANATAAVAVATAASSAPTAVNAAATAVNAAAPQAGAAVDMAAAKAEGSVSWYTSTPQDLADQIGKLFEQQSGIKVQVFRSGGEQVMQRFLAEQDAGKTAADVLTTSDQAAFMDLASDGKLLAYKPVGWEFVPDNFKDKDGLWFSQRLNLEAPIYRTDQVTDPPTSWKDLASPRFKGKLVTPDPSFTSIALLIDYKLSGLLGWDYFSQLARNDMMIVQGHAQVAQALLSGERSVALEADLSALVPEIQKGAPIKLTVPEEGSFLITSPQGIPIKAPHPNAARAFMDFNLSPVVQNLIAQAGIHSVRTDIGAPPGLPELKSLKTLDVDYAAAAADNKKVKDHFAEIFH